MNALILLITKSVKNVVLKPIKTIIKVDFCSKNIRMLTDMSLDLIEEDVSGSPIYEEAPQGFAEDTAVLSRSRDVRDTDDNLDFAQGLIEGGMRVCIPSWLKKNGLTSLASIGTTTDEIAKVLSHCTSLHCDPVEGHSGRFVGDLNVMRNTAEAYFDLIVEQMMIVVNMSSHLSQDEQSQVLQVMFQDVKEKIANHTLTVPSVCEAARTCIDQVLRSSVARTNVA